MDRRTGNRNLPVLRASYTQRSEEMPDYGRSCWLAPVRAICRVTSSPLASQAAPPCHTRGRRRDQIGDVSNHRDNLRRMISIRRRKNRFLPSFLPSFCPCLFLYILFVRCPSRAPVPTYVDRPSDLGHGLCLVTHRPTIEASQFLFDIGQVLHHSDKRWATGERRTTELPGDGDGDTPDSKHWAQWLRPGQKFLYKGPFGSFIEIYFYSFYYPSVPDYKLESQNILTPSESRPRGCCRVGKSPWEMGCLCCPAGLGSRNGPKDFVSPIGPQKKNCVLGCI